MNRFKQRILFSCTLLLSSVLLSLFGISCGDDVPPSEDLIIISVGNLEPNTDVWFFLSDSQGNEIGASHATMSNDEIIFGRPADFTEETFTLNIFRVITDEPAVQDRVMRVLTTYTHLEPGRHFKFPDTAESTPDGTKPFTVHVSDVTSEFRAVLGVPGAVNDLSHFDDGILTIDHFADNESSAFLYVHDDGIEHGRYKFLQGIESDDTYNFSYDDLSPLEERFLDTGIESPDAVYATQMGYPGKYVAPEGLVLNYSAFSNTNSQTVPNQIRLIKPGDLFGNFSFGLSVRKENITHSYFTVSSALPTVFRKIDVDLTQYDFAADEFSLTVDGDADDVFVSLWNNLDEGEVLYQDVWGVYAPVSNQISVKRPKFPVGIPSELIEGYYSGSLANVIPSVRFADLDINNGYNPVPALGDLDEPNTGDALHKYYAFEK